MEGRLETRAQHKMGALAWCKIAVAAAVAFCGGATVPGVRCGDDQREKKRFTAAMGAHHIELSLSLPLFALLRGQSHRQSLWPARWSSPIPDFQEMGSAVYHQVPRSLVPPCGVYACWHRCYSKLWVNVKLVCVRGDKHALIIGHASLVRATGTPF